jgi:hypothetical protein
LNFTFTFDVKEYESKNKNANASLLLLFYLADAGLSANNTQYNNLNTGTKNNLDATGISSNVN